MAPPTYFSEVWHDTPAYARHSRRNLSASSSESQGNEPNRGSNRTSVLGSVRPGCCAGQPRATLGGSVYLGGAGRGHSASRLSWPSPVRRIAGEEGCLS